MGRLPLSSLCGSTKKNPKTIVALRETALLPQLPPNKSTLTGVSNQRHRRPCVPLSAGVGQIPDPHLKNGTQAKNTPKTGGISTTFQRGRGRKENAFHPTIFPICWYFTVKVVREIMLSLWERQASRSAGRRPQKNRAEARTPLSFFITIGGIK